jgi:DNA-binding NtrC family response regulator
MKFRIFVVDDDPHYARLVSYRMEKNPDHQVRVFSSGEDALEAAAGERPHLVLLDIMMPGIGGIETLRRLSETAPETHVVMLSAQGVIDTAVESMKLGAYDYITKGQDDIVKLELVVQRVRERVELEQEVDSLRSEVSQRYSIAGLIGDSEPMQGVYRLVDKALRGDLTVAIHGESGTGKELVAKAIHFSSARKRGPFVVVNCAAIPRDLMESEFFGHEKGSFTGADKKKIGKFEQADGGTIFLDEIGELDLDLQAKLLRALQSREISRVGGNDTISFDARVISATNRDVLQMIREGSFREDLYYRLFQYPVPLPPLRERGDDILLLATFFLRDYTSAHQEFKGKTLGYEAKRAILDYNWPGNVRELKSAIERAILISDEDEIGEADLMIGGMTTISPWADRMPLAQQAEPQPRPAPPKPETVASLTESAPAAEVGGVALGDDAGEIVSIEDLKQQAVERAYRLCDGNVDKAAVELGIGRATMYRLLKKYGVMT